MANMTKMTDAQCAAVTHLLRRKDEGGDVVRFRDTKTVMSLYALDKRGMAHLNYEIVDGRRQVVGATLTGFGMRTYLARQHEIADAERMDRLTGRPFKNGRRSVIEAAPSV